MFIFIGQIIYVTTNRKLLTLFKLKFLWLCVSKNKAKVSLVLTYAAGYRCNVNCNYGFTSIKAMKRGKKSGRAFKAQRCAILTVKPYNNETMVRPPTIRGFHLDKVCLNNSASPPEFNGKGLQSFKYKFSPPFANKCLIGQCQCWLVKIWKPTTLG